MDSRSFLSLINRINPCEWQVLVWEGRHYHIYLPIDGGTLWKVEGPNLQFPMFRASVNDANSNCCCFNTNVHPSMYLPNCLKLILVFFFCQYIWLNYIIVIHFSEDVKSYVRCIISDHAAGHLVHGRSYRECSGNIMQIGECGMVLWRCYEESKSRNNLVSWFTCPAITCPAMNPIWLTYKSLIYIPHSLMHMWPVIESKIWTLKY